MMIDVKGLNKYQFLFFKFVSTLMVGIILSLTSFSPQLIASAVEVKTENEHKKQVQGKGVGKFILQYDRSSAPVLRDVLRENKIFDRIITGLNQSGLIMRQDIPVIFTNCGEPNAFWDPSNERIIMCYEMIGFGVQLFQEQGNYGTSEALDKSINNTIFTFYHELGHALIDVLQLSAVGQEEDTVDEFASVMLLSNSQGDLAEIILDAAEFYQIVNQISTSAPWDEHAPHDKRLFNLVCFVYGSNPEKYEQIFIEKFILVDPDQKVSREQIESRARRCYQEFPQKVANWNKLLLPHYASKNNTQPTPTPHGNTPGVSRRGDYW